MMAVRIAGGCQLRAPRVCTEFDSTTLEGGKRASLARTVKSFGSQLVAAGFEYDMPLTRGSAGFAGQQLCLHHLPARPALHMGRPGRLVVQARTVEPTVGMWGTKQGMDQFFTTEGECYAATIINFAPGNIVTQIKTPERDGYTAVQVGYRITEEKDFSKDSRKVTRRRTHVTKPEAGHCKKAGAPLMRTMREFKVQNAEGYEPGQQLQFMDIFKEGDKVDIAGKSKGHGFQGNMKRWNHARGPMSHGSKSHRQPGSIGASATPSRVFPGKKMPGHLGDERIKIRQLEVLKLFPEDNIMVVKGAVPGKKGGFLEIVPAKELGVNVPSHNIKGY